MADPFFHCDSNYPGGIKQALYLKETLAEYLLFKLNLRAAESDAAPMGHPDRGMYSPSHRVSL